MNKRFQVPRIEHISKKKFIGSKLRMSFAENKTFQLWSAFMPRRKEINNAVSPDLFSLQVYEENYFRNFDPAKAFDKWALVEVADFKVVPEGMETFTLEAGQYAVFIHKGLNTDTSTFEYIFHTWLPNADYVLDNRPHFEILGAKYKNNDPDSEEEIWIPVKSRS